MPSSSKPQLGSLLEWHRGSIRVVVKVPPKLQDVVGKKRLRALLGTKKPLEAEALKWPVIAELKRQIAHAKSGAAKGASTPSYVETALAIRDELRAARKGRHPTGLSEDTMDEIIDMTVDRIMEQHGPQRATVFDDVARGRATPLDTYKNDWLQRLRSGRTKEAWGRALDKLSAWCAKNDFPETLEAVTPEVAGDYVTKQFERKGVRRGTANKDIGALSSYWNYLVEKSKAERNPWEKKRLKKEPPSITSDIDLSKRPFTSEEATALIIGITDRTTADMQAISALSGMRISEIAALRVKHVSGQKVTVPGTKTANARRVIPIHPALASLMQRRTEGKDADDYLIEELPDQLSDRRSRAAPVSQAFTRYRRNLGVDDRVSGISQSRIDFHSWRRWFIQQAGQAFMQTPGCGFTPWTIADVVGHGKDDMPCP